MPRYPGAMRYVRRGLRQAYPVGVSRSARLSRVFQAQAGRVHYCQSGVCLSECRDDCLSCSQQEGWPGRQMRCDVMLSAQGWARRNASSCVCACCTVRRSSNLAGADMYCTRSYMYLRVWP
jgi:hypothetical protein